MANFYNTNADQVVPVVHHKVGERVVVLINGSQFEPPKLQIRDLDTGKYFNKNTAAFEDFSFVANQNSYYTFTMNELYGMNVYNAVVSSLPKERQQLLFEYQTVSFSDEGGVISSSAVNESSAEVIGEPFYAPSSGSYDVEFSLTPGATDVVFAEVLLNGSDVDYTQVSLTPKNNVSSDSLQNFKETFSFSLNNVFSSDEISFKVWGVPFDQGPTLYDSLEISDIKVYSNFFERHVFGGEVSASENATCTIYGTLLDVSGNPMAGQKVEVYLNRAGYFTHKSGLVGYAATALTDESGYWEIPIIIGLDVTINIPVIGFSQSGFVPALTSVELTPETLLKYKN